MIRLICTDGSAFFPEISSDLALKSEVLKSMQEDGLLGLHIDNTPIPYDVENVINYIKMCELHNKHHIELKPNDDSISPFEDQFLKSLLISPDKYLRPLLTSTANLDWDDVLYRYMDPIGNLLCISDFLDNTHITNTCSKYLADELSQKDVESLRKIFKIENDLSQEEENNIKKKNLWCDN